MQHEVACEVTASISNKGFQSARKHITQFIGRRVKQKPKKQIHHSDRHIRKALNTKWLRIQGHKLIIFPKQSFTTQRPAATLGRLHRYQKKQR